MNDKKLILFLDSIGRTMIGEKIDSEEISDREFAVKNPAILNIMPTQNESMQVQIIPQVFREVLTMDAEDPIFYYNKDNITMSNIVGLNERISAQYNAIFNFRPAVQSTSPVGAGPIKLFDEESK